MRCPQQKPLTLTLSPRVRSCRREALTLTLSRGERGTRRAVIAPRSRRGDAAVARLPLVAVAPRPPYEVPADVLVLDVSHDASSTAVRDGRTDWMAPEAAEFDDLSGAWSDPDRYDDWLQHR